MLLFCPLSAFRSFQAEGFLNRLCQMSSAQQVGQQSPPRGRSGSSTFGVTCSLLALIALCQLLFMGFTIASRSGETREVIRYVESEPIVVRVPYSETQASTEVEFTPRSIDQILQDTVADYTPTPTLSPTLPDNLDPLALSPSLTDSQVLSSIDNPIAAKHVSDAEALHMKGDMSRALIKLDEASKYTQEDHPHLLYIKAIIHEDMGLWKKASDLYLSIYKQGTDAGKHYDIASKKLARGLRPVDRYTEVISLGQVITRPAQDRKSCQVTIPIRTAPQHKIIPEKVRIDVHFYDTSNGKDIKPATPSSRREKTWESLPIDWMGLGEETLHFDYSISENEVSEAPLYGRREYYGQVIELYYRDQLVDTHASPRTLHSEHAKLKQPPQSLFQPFDLPGFTPEINPDNPLLPALPTR